ncbi:Sterile alpha motif domain-containing protein 5 [Hondaea fermentalgiana]|uniref:Sterile alpha motif domain-containing protein 5 n=1 Tax=Hondaea fermentalgiana TaxID=2315210 RepID=A0A2R5GMF8_9STRA|nr:Sterile alpha motif domain-containing protein 5 [Hondaea fermentalgiana]|eukprot:GBG29823.1 Sterile alpha motif domain-containing protein 5 [Hondaea fermentalgiana]
MASEEKKASLEAAGTDIATWIERTDARTGRTYWGNLKTKRAYYFNAQTGKSTWTKPACGQIIKATLWQQLKAKGRAIRQKTQQGVVTLTKSKETVQKETTDHTNSDTTETKDALSEAVAAPSLDGAKSDVEAGETDERNIETKTASDIADATEAPRDALPLHGDHADACEKEILEDDPSATVCEDGSIEGWLWVQAQTQQALKMYSCLRNGALICTETKPSDSTKSDEMALQFDMKVATDVCVYDSEDVADNTDKESGALECTFCHENFVAWASSHGFDANVDKFASAGYDDLELLAGLNDDDLKEMLAHHVEIAKPGHRMKVVLAVRKLRSLIKST